MNEFVLTFVDVLATVLWIALIGRVVISWLNVGPSSAMYPVVSILYQITEPILAPIRRVLPSFGMLDLSPMVAIILITIVRRVLVAAVG
ncbi:MAG: YggT family protein [Chloroflexi bacterium]|nr:YggT family protein [Chloroflexota bacterium]